MTARRPILGAFLNGVPDVENLYPILAGLRDGGRVELDLFVTSGLWRREARVRKLLRGSGMAYRVRPNKLMKAGVYYRRLLRGVDRLLVIGDPCHDESVFGARGRYIKDAGIPTIYMQHGVIQQHLTYSDDGSATEFHSDPVFLWEDPSCHDGILAPDVAPRIRISGFTKKPVFELRRPPEALSRRLAGFRKRVLICHTFRGGGHDATQIEQAYGMIRAYCERNPDVAVIVRPHRGKVRSNYSQHDRQLGRDCPNVLFSFQHSGPLKGMNIVDVLSLVDCIVSTPSTAVLDGLYLGRPAALMAAENCRQLMSLPVISDQASLEAFVEGGMTDPMRRMLDHYGDVDQNVSRVCAMIEERLLTEAAA